MIHTLYLYHLRRPSSTKGFVKKRIKWYLYRFLKYALHSYYSRIFRLRSNCLDSNSDVIVSLTSLPSRIYQVHLTIKSIFNQSYKPFKIVLWLGEEKFPNRYKDLPKTLLDLETLGLEIKFCEDLGPHTKYYHAFTAYKNYKVVTVDDDLFYPKDMLQILVSNSEDFPKSVIANRVRDMRWSDGDLDSYRSWPINTSAGLKPSLNVFATGVGGVLYKPLLFSDKIYDVVALKQLCKTADDIWLKVNQVYDGVPVVFTNYYLQPFIELPNSQNKSLHKSNVFSGGNDAMLRATFSHFNINYKRSFKE